MKFSNYLDEAAHLAIKGMKHGEGGPFGAVIVKNGEIVGRGWNQTYKINDPTAHAEIQAIRNACKRLKTTELTGSTIYCSCEPCPMCMAAIYWATIDSVYFACTKEEAAEHGFDDSKVYQELALPWNARALSIVHHPTEKATAAFTIWEQMKLHK